MDINGVEVTPDMYWLLGLGVLAGLVIRFFYCNTIRKTLLLIDEENRFMKPQEAWLAMIPIFNIYWNFKLAEKVSDSLTNEFYDRQIAEEQDPGKAIGYSFAALFALSNIPIAPSFLMVMNIFSFIFFIRYWLKVSTFKTLLEEHNRVFDYEKTKTEDES